VLRRGPTVGKHAVDPSKERGPAARALKARRELVAVVAMAMMRVAMPAPDTYVDARPIAVHLAAMPMAAMAVAPARYLLDCGSISGHACAGHADRSGRSRSREEAE
jgi:hypothetical protein